MRESLRYNGSTMDAKLKSLLVRYRAAAERKERDLVRYQVEGEITRILVSTIDRYAEHLGEIVGTVSALVDAQRVSVMVRKGKFLEIAASCGIPQDAIELRSLVRIGSGIAGKVAETGEPIHAIDLTRDDGLKENAIGGPAFTSNSFICIPLAHEGEVVGVLNAANPTTGKSFTKADFAFLVKIAQKIAMFLKKSMAFEAMRTGKA